MEDNNIKIIDPSQGTETKLYKYMKSDSDVKDVNKFNQSMHS